MNKSDRDLGMDRDITRRDFIHDTSLAALGLTFEDFEREVRTVLDGMLGPAGADASTHAAIDQA